MAGKAKYLPVPAPDKVCTGCKTPGGTDACGYRARSASAGGGLQAECVLCERGRTNARRHADAQRRLTSEYSSLKPEDFDVTVGNDGRVDKEAAAQKRQEYSEAMGEFADDLRASGGDPDVMPEGSGTYIARLAEQERRFGNRRIARSVSLAAAHEALALRQLKAAVQHYLADKVTPTGYATAKPAWVRRKRTVVLHLSDLHLGSDLCARDNPRPYTAVEEARRLEYVVRQALDYKPQYRADSELLLLLNGDLVEGYLLHDLRDGAPLAEQKVIFWRYFRVIIGLLAQQYPSVRVFCQPGNHGRDKVRHPGRATSSKWDGHETSMYWALREMCSSLANVTWDIPFKAVSAIDLYGSKLLLTHGDTEVKLGDPDTKAERNAHELAKINSTRIYGCEFDVAAFGHYHKPRYIPGRVKIIWNGALVPPNGHARSSGWINEPCGQFLWEAVEGHPVGDVRFVEVGSAQDKDDKLGTLVQPFRFSEDAGATL
jgi:hypothetical protein